jgi:hypothetical protein
MADATTTLGYWAQVRRDAAGDLVSAAVYFAAYLAAPWWSDAALTGLVVGVALQFFVLTPLLGAVTPRGPRRIALVVVAHGALFALLAWIASRGGQRAPDWVACALAQAPLVLRNLARLRRPEHQDGPWILEAIGPFLLLMPVIPVTVLLVAILPDLGLATRELRFDLLAPLPPHDLKFALLAGMVYFAGTGLARVAWERLGGEGMRRADVGPDTIRRWREEYRRSRGR